MGEVVNVVVAFAVIVFIIRWATRGGEGENEETRRARSLLGFHPKHVSTDMVSTVHSMFPHIPRDNIHYDLLKTGNVEITSNKLLERGFLDAPPPPYFQLFPVQSAPATAAPSSSAQVPTAASSSKLTSKPTLISRFDLEDRLRAGTETATTAIEAGGKATWEDTPERREASLRERKAQMVLAARKRFLEQRKDTADTSA